VVEKVCPVAEDVNRYPTLTEGRPRGKFPDRPNRLPQPRIVMRHPRLYGEAAMDAVTPVMRALVMLAVAVAACDRGPRRADSGAAKDSSRQLTAIALVQENPQLPAAPPTAISPADAEQYRRIILASVLSDLAVTDTVRPTAADDTSLTNFQLGGWRLGGEDTFPTRNPVRFFANFDRFTSGVLVVTLDTTLTRTRHEPPFDMRMADSIAIGGLGRRERFAIQCRFGTHDIDDQIVGLVRDTTSEQWQRARLAWLFDTATARIRAMRPDSVSCRLQNPD